MPVAVPDGLVALFVAEDALGPVACQFGVLVLIVVVGPGAHVLQVHLDDFLVDRVDLLELDEIGDEALDQVDVDREALLVVRPGLSKRLLLLLEQVVLLLQLRNGLDYLLYTLPVAILHLLLHRRLLLV